MAQRTNFYFPPEAVQWLDSVASRTHLNNSVEIIRASLSVYAELIELYDSQCTIVIKDKKGDAWPFSPHMQFVYPGLDTVEVEKHLENQKKFRPKTFMFPSTATEQIDIIRNRSRLTNNADVIRTSLRVFDMLVRVIEKGDEIFITDSIGNSLLYNPLIPLKRDSLVLIDAPKTPATKSLRKFDVPII